MLTWKDITQPNKKHPEDEVKLFAGYLGEVQVATVQGPTKSKPGWRGFIYQQWKDAKTQDFYTEDGETLAKEWCADQVEAWIKQLGLIKPRPVPFADEA